MTRADKIKIAIVAILLALQIVYAQFITKPAHFTVDEGVYHMMARSIVRDGSLAVWNGYAETPSEELVYALLRTDLRDPAAPRLVPQYPSVYALLAAPFYAVGGFAGLFWINLLAFFGTVWATGAVARRLFHDRALTLNAILFLTLGTFTWEYVQAVWPHSLSMFLVTSAVLAALIALEQENSRSSFGWAVLAGAITGLASGIRYDAILLAPAIALPFLFASPVRWKPVMGLIAGITPGLLILTLTNQAKFGVLSPFSYGADAKVGAASILGYIALAAGAGGGVMLSWIATRAPVRKHYEGRPLLIVGGALATIAIILLVPQLQDLTLRLISGTWEIIVDLRYRPEIEEWGVSRTATGGLVYGEWLKKALLQNCPWLVLLGIPAVTWLRRPTSRQAVPLLVIGAFIALYGFQRWHGGLGLNMRYFLSFLPLASILAAGAWRDLFADIPGGWQHAIVALGLGSALIWIPLILSDTSLAVEPILLNTPLLLAGILAASLISRGLPISAVRKIAGPISLGTAAACLAWAFSVSFTYDLPRSTGTRSFNYEVGTEIRPMIEPNSILFTRYANRVSLLIDDEIPLAFPRNDDFEDFRRLTEIYLQQDRPVYLAFNEEYWQQAETGNFLVGLKMEELYEKGDVRLVRLWRDQ